MVDAIESKLQQNQWLGGQQPSDEDAEAFKNMAAAPVVDTHPNAFAWFSLVGRFTDAIRDSWTAAAPQAAAGVSTLLDCLFCARLLALLKLSVKLFPVNEMTN